MEREASAARPAGPQHFHVHASGTQGSSDAASPAAGLLAGGDGKTAPLIMFKLIGVAEDQGPDGVTRTAILSAQGQLYMVKEGETLAWIYRVGRVSGDSVELLDTTGGDPLTLFLK